MKYKNKLESEKLLDNLYIILIISPRFFTKGNLNEATSKLYNQ